MTHWTFIDPKTVFWDDWLLLAIQATGLIALIIYVWKTWEMAFATRQAAEAALSTAQESRDARLEALAPRIVVYFDGDRHLTANVVIYNAGAGTAGDLRLTFDPPLATTSQPELLEFFEIPQSVFPPGYRLEQMFDNWPGYLQSALPRQYAVTVQYTGLENGRQYATTQLLSVDGMKHRLVDAEAGMQEQMLTAVRNVATELAGLKRVVSLLHYAQLYRAPLTGTFATRVRHLIALWGVQRALDSTVAFIPEWSAFLEVAQSETLALSVESRIDGANRALSIAIDRVLATLFDPSALAMGNGEWMEGANLAFGALHEALAEGSCAEGASRVPSPDI